MTGYAPYLYYDSKQVISWNTQDNTDTLTKIRNGLI